MVWSWSAGRSTGVAITKAHSEASFDDDVSESEAKHNANGQPFSYPGFASLSLPVPKLCSPYVTTTAEVAIAIKKNCALNAHKRSQLSLRWEFLYGRPAQCGEMIRYTNEFVLYTAERRPKSEVFSISCWPRRCEALVLHMTYSM